MATVNERLQDAAVSHAVDLQQYGNGMVQRMAALLNRADADIFSRLQEALADVDGQTATVERLESLLASVRALNLQAYRELERNLTAELRELADYEAAHQLELFQATVPASIQATVSVAAVNVDQVFAAAMARPFQGRLLREWAADIGEARMVRVRDAIRMGFVQGETVPQMVRRIRGTRAKGYADGLVEMDRRGAEAMVRTAISHTAGYVRDRFNEANRDLVKAQTWNATLDARTSPQCFPASTLVVPVGELVSVSKRRYKGEVIVVTTASGKQLRATPNHPVLTARGWRPVQELSPGNDVLYRVDTNAIGIGGTHDVGVPATMGALADAISHPAVGKVLVERAAEADFHGDGEVGEQQIYVPLADRGLGDALSAASFNGIAHTLLAGVAFAGSLAGHRLGNQFFRGGRFVNVAAEFDASAPEDGVQDGAANAASPHDFNRLDSGSVHGDQVCLVAPAERLAPALLFHDASALEDSGEGGCGDGVMARDRRGALPAGVTPDDVVSVRRELFDEGHVFNLQSSGESYIADGFIVHNCRIRDGKEYEPVSPYKPIGHSLPWLGGPGRLHWQCRSVSVPVLKSWRELGIPMDELPAGTRASMDGQVPADQTFGQWIKRQSAARQDQVLGPTRAKLMRAGGLDLDRFYTDKGRVLSLDELRQRDAEAFRRAGL